MGEKIYLHINHKETKKLIKEFIAEYNTKLKKGNPMKKDMQLYKGKEYDKNDPKHYRKFNITSNEIATIEAVVDMFGAWLLQNKKLGITPTDRNAFRLNNAWIAKKRTGISKTTIWRHLDKLQDCGIIMNKLFLGVKVGYELGINPKLLVSHDDRSYTELLTAIFLNVHNIAEITDLPEVVRVLIATQKPLFSDYPQGFLIASCNEIITKNIFKINDEIGKILQGQNFSSFFILPEQGSAVSPAAEKFTFSDFPLKKDFSGEGGLAFSMGIQATKTIEEMKLKPAFDFKEDDLKHHWLTNTVQDCIYLILSTLYSGKTFSEDELEYTRQHLRWWFGDGTKSYNAIQKSKIKFANLVLKCKSWIDASPERFIPKPSKWLDPNFEHGFKGLIKWEESNKINKAELDSYNINRKLLAKLLVIYYEDTSLHNYQYGRDILSKKLDKNLLALFDKCVRDKNNFTPKEFEKYNSPLLNKEKKSKAKL